jgi:YD repeat-containing protein
VSQDYAQPPNVRTNTYQLTVTGAGMAYSYDLNGNLTGDGTKTFEWDAENRLTAVKQGAAALASFAYDGQGRRAQKTAGGVSRTYVYDDEGVIEERLSSGQRCATSTGAISTSHWRSEMVPEW